MNKNSLRSENGNKTKDNEKYEKTGTSEARLINRIQEIKERIVIEGMIEKMDTLNKGNIKAGTIKRPVLLLFFETGFPCVFLTVLELFL